jgi:hypothetical protein
MVIEVAVGMLVAWPARKAGRAGEHLDGSVNASSARTTSAPGEPARNWPRYVSRTTSGGHA